MELTNNEELIKLHNNTIHHAIEKMLNKDIVKNYYITGIISDGSESILKLSKRTFSLSDEEYKSRYES